MCGHPMFSFCFGGLEVGRGHRQCDGDAHDAGSVGDDADDGDDGGLVRGRNGSRADPAGGLGDSLREQPDVERPARPPSGDRRAGAATVRTFSEVGPRFQDSNQESLVGKENNALFGRTYGASIEQPLFRGGQTVAAIRGAENTVRAERARLESTEQSVLLNAATAYSDVYRDQAVLELNIHNEQRLARQLEATRDRFQVGEVTRTDVSQAEARLARATAERIAAEGALAASRATFRNVVGVVPEVLARPPLPRELPASLADATRSRPTTT